MEPSSIVGEERAPLAHGGRLVEARRLFPGAPEPFLDLSTGINPHPYPVPVLDPDCFARLPEPEWLATLEAAAAAAYGVANPGCIAAAPGTQSLIQVLPRLASTCRVAVLGPTYAEHMSAWSAAGHAVREAATLDDAMSADTVVLCNPNNPDGRRLDPVALLACARDLDARGGLLVVDEAFADLEHECSVAPDQPCRGLVVLRSFGKVFGLAGIRLGFAIASGERARAIRIALGPWPVSGPAIAIGAAALADRQWLAATSARLARDAARLDGLLQHAGLTLVGGTALFRLARHPSAPALFDRLGRAGLLVRRFGDRPEWLRFGIPGSPGAFKRLVQALQ